jgi:hypothetical protein
VEFEDWLSIQVVKNRATRDKNLHLEIEKGPKKVKPAYPFFKLRFLMLPLQRAKTCRTRACHGFNYILLTERGYD